LKRQQDVEVRHVALALCLVLVASISIFLLYSPTLNYGFDYDDYHFVRPYSRAEIQASFHRSWDPAAIERPYYRPLTIAFFAARFEALGINATAHHALSLILFSMAAALAGWFAFRLGDSARLGLLATAMYVVHPAMPYALVAWVTNQMHLIESIVVLIALIWWTDTRHRHAIWWIPLLGLAVAAFLIKEDGVMLLPSILVLHYIRRRLVEPALAPPPVPFVAAAAITIGVLFGIRGWALANAGTIRAPAVSAAFHNYLHGLNGLLRLVPADRRWQSVASWFVTVIPLAALARWRRMPPTVKSVFLSGVAIALLFNLPFVLITKAEQMHLVTLGAVLMLAAACVGVVSSVGIRPARYAVTLACVAGVAALVAVARDISHDFEPFGPTVLAHDKMVGGWTAVPVDLREYLSLKRVDRPSPNPAIALPIVRFGMHGPERSPDGITYRWMSEPRSEVLISPRTRTITIPLRHAFEVFREPARVRIRSDGRLVDEMVLDTSAWRTSTTAIRSADAGLLMRMHRIVIQIDHAWSPADIIPGSHDDRTLGLQIGEVTLR
jgi:hypothetical protein